MRGGHGVGWDLGDVFDKWVLYYLSRSWRDIGLYILLIFFSHPGTSYLFIFTSYLKVRALLWHPWGVQREPHDKEIACLFKPLPGPRWPRRYRLCFLTRRSWVRSSPRPGSASGVLPRVIHITGWPPWCGRCCLTWAQYWAQKTG